MFLLIGQGGKTINVADDSMDVEYQKVEVGTSQKSVEKGSSEFEETQIDSEKTQSRAEENVIGVIVPMKPVEEDEESEEGSIESKFEADSKKTVENPIAKCIYCQLNSTKKN